MWLKEILLFVFSLAFAESACPTNFSSVSNGCYYFFTNAEAKNQQCTWYEARNKCKAMGADLAVVNDCHEFTALTRYIAVGPGNDIPTNFGFWIGGSDEEQEGHWHWVDYSPMALGAPFWGSKLGVIQPSGGLLENCVQMYKPDRYYFHDGDCSKSGFGLCQIDPL